ncbi:hypothetical protein DN752_21535 [Echinicola strongylocentroti]|uniref:DUF354 domain-containing protein n=1 Tax=Echinicola strongylocentroti TaxID=1795355 RepID=A0A2Z4INV1_9BACT|nr:DUF354 domain-containing protein [Echinicola strongylocentroti]AWW32524.1 hypothetical protein DN752_21535 [Echinicola strongylocentroti]
MKILIDINHPAHVHYFRNFYKIMTENGHKLVVVSRNKEIEHKLLEAHDIPYVDRGKGKNGRIGKLLYLLYADFKLLSIAKKFKPDVFLNFLHPYPSHIAKLMNKPSIVFSDTEHATLHAKLTVPYATAIHTPSCYRTDLGEKQHRFQGFMELSYLHPNYFTPDPGILDIIGVKPNEKFVIVRFVAWGSVHDFGHSGMSLDNKRKAIKEISKHAKVLITSEKPLPEDLEKYRIKIPIDKIHHALFYSSLLFGESATMASEAAVLGTPAIFLDNDGRGYTDEQEKEYSLVYNFTEAPQDQENAISKAIEILSNPESEWIFKERRKKLLANCIDTTSYMIEKVLAYAPRQIKKSPALQKVKQRAATLEIPEHH